MPKPHPLRLFALSAPTALLLAAACCVPSARAEEVTEKQIEDTINVFKEATFKSQTADGRFPGSWEGRGPTAGTGIGTLSLIVSGESMQHPKIEKALDYLEKAEPKDIYEVGMLAHVWSYLPFADYLSYQDKLELETKRILASKGNPGNTNAMMWGRYAVGQPSGGDDLSVTQYMVLGLWQARKRGLHVDPYFWDAMAKQMISRQNPDGGWGYGGPTDGHNKESTQAMTCAGMTILFVCQQERDRSKGKADPVITASLDRGQSWVEKHFTVDDDHSAAWHHHLNGYLYYGYERIALASGLRYIKGQDWFTSIGGRIVKDGLRAAGSPENRAFKLMFLARGKSPVWCNKLIVPGANWRNRPNDIYFANKWLSEMTKGELNWMAVDINSTSDRWLNAPVTYLSVDERITLDETQEKNLRNYVDHGGILVLNAESGSAATWAREFAKKLYPKYPLGNPVPGGMLADGFPEGVIPGVQAIHNGARDMVLVVQGDHGMKWQADVEPDYKNGAWRFLFNLYRVASDRGKRVPRLLSPFELPNGQRNGDSVKVVIPKYEGNCQPENRPYDIMDIYVGNRTGAKVAVDMGTDLAKVGESDGSLLHIMGTDVVTLKPEEIAAIKAFVDKGGTVLVETVGGHAGKSGLFASTMKESLQSAFGAGTEARKLAEDSPLIKGMDFPGAQDNTAIDRVLWRQVTVERGQKDPKMRIEVIVVKDASGKEREAVLFSDEDLTLGMNRIRTYGINGYEQGTAQHFMLNLLAQSFKSKPSPK